MKENEIIVHFNEALRSLRTTIGVLVQDNEGKTISDLASRVFHKNGNVEFVEALTLLHAIRWVYQNNYKFVNLRGDCQILIYKVDVQERNLSATDYTTDHVIDLILDVFNFF